MKPVCICKSRSVARNGREYWEKRIGKPARPTEDERSREDEEMLVTLRRDPDGDWDGDAA